MMRMSNVLLTDSYKPSHHLQYPPGMEFLDSFFAARGGYSPYVVFFGLQYYLKEYFAKTFTREDVDEATEFWAEHFGNPKIFNRDGFIRVLERHGGRLPLEIRAVPEGTVVPIKNALMTFRNTGGPEDVWLTNYMETMASLVWYPTSVATQGHMFRRDILEALIQSGTPEAIDFKLHCFGFRGSTSVESAAIGGAAHLVNFKGSDTTPGILLARNYYHERMAGFSVPAAEHSTITSWGRDRELAAYRNMIEQFPTARVAVVSDSYDVFNACENLWGKELREQVLQRDGVLVIRPDSGDPIDVNLKVLDILSNRFGSTYNDKGYRVLNPKVRLIQGDGISKDGYSPRKILNALMREGWSADNIGFGSGGGNLQKMDRDTHKFAFKASAAQINGQIIDVYKDPVTDPGKVSLRGQLALQLTDRGYQTVRLEDLQGENQLVPVFRNGEILKDYTFAEIRERAKSEE